MDFDFVVLISVLLFSIVVHEVAHAWQARREGDDTADRLGRITLNPIPHLDPVGSFLVPLILYLGPGGFLFGWAKPVPVNPQNYRSLVAGDIRVSLAGIVSNLGLAVLFTLLGAVVAAVGPLPGGTPATVAGYVADAANFGVFINLILAFFNLIPIPPLDGSHVLYYALPRGLRDAYRSISGFGIVILLGLMFLMPGLFQVLLAPVFFFMDQADAFVRLFA